MEKEILYQDKKIYYRVEGSGKKVVLVHGFGEDGRVWGNQVEYLKDNLQLIIPDLPGSGKSEMIADMSIEGMADVIKAIVDQEIKQRPSTTPDSRPLTPNYILLGHSMGGYITLAFAEKYPEHLAAFGLVHSTAFPDNEEKKATRQKAISLIREHGAYEFLKTAIPNLFSKDSQSKLAGIISELIEQGNNFSPDSLVSYYQAMIQRPGRTEVLKKAKVPVLFIMGKYDIAVPMDDVLKQCHLPEKSYIHILHHSGHMGMLEEAEKTNRLLEQFTEEM